MTKRPLGIGSASDPVKMKLKSMATAVLVVVSGAALSGCALTHRRVSDGSVVYWKQAQLAEFKAVARRDLACDDVSVKWVALPVANGHGPYFAQGCGVSAEYACSRVPDDGSGDDEYESYRLRCRRR
jgi:hypothetical protein